MFRFGFTTLFFLPVIESFSREAGLVVLFLGTLLVSFNPLWKERVRIGAIGGLFLLFIIWAAISTIFSISIYRSVVELSRYLAYFLIFNHIRQNQENRIFFKKFFIKSIIFNSVVLSLLFIFLLISGSGQGMKLSGMNLFYPAFGHNRIADILIMAIPLLLGLLSNREKRIKRSILWGLLLFLSGILLLSLSRGSMLALGLGLSAVYFLPGGKKNFLGKGGFLFMALTGFIIVSVFIFSHFVVTKNQGWKYYSGLYKPVFNEKRTEYFRQAILGFAKSPIAGTGPDTFRYISQKLQSKPAGWSWYTHNHFLQLFSDTGFPGGAIFVLLTVLLFYEASHVSGKSGQGTETGIFAALLVSAIHSWIDFDWQFISILLYVFMGFAVLTEITEVKRTVNLRFLYISAVFLFSVSGFLIKEYREIEHINAIIVLKECSGKPA